MFDKTNAIFVVFYYEDISDMEYMIKAFRTENKAEKFKATVEIEADGDLVYWKQVELVE